MEEGEVVVPKLWVHFDSKPNDKGQPSNRCKKVPIINTKRNISETSTRTTILDVQKYVLIINCFQKFLIVTALSSDSIGSTCKIVIVSAASLRTYTYKKLTTI